MGLSETGFSTMEDLKQEQVWVSNRSPAKDNIVEISSSSEKSCTGQAPEPGEEAISSLHPSSPCPHKKPRLEIISTEAHAGSGIGNLHLARNGDSDNRNLHVQHDGGDMIYDDDDDLPDDFLAPLDSPISSSPHLSSHTDSSHGHGTSAGNVLKQFWKAGDYESVQPAEDLDISNGMEHVRVHPKFLHSNATSHKWALGAMAELLDNALDEAVNGATFVNVDMIKNPRDGRPMVVVEDDGGGMDPERMRQCMSLGYSAKSKIANTIGQYGNGFKTSTMRLGADVVVFSRHQSKESSLPTQSIGLLSYTFLTATGQDDIIVPMLDYEVHPFGLRKLVRGTLDDWNTNMETILQWSPYDTEKGLFEQLERIKGHGTIIIVYNLWEDEDGNLELDFDADSHDIQLKGTSRDEKSITMASKYPHCKHFFTYRYSLRSYASILYLKFRMFLRGQQVVHHRLVSDLMIIEQVKYKPLKASVLSQKDAVTVVTMGFVKHAGEHIDVQGFNVYHKNRLIKPFWRVWNYPGIQGRGIFGVLEANFVEPAHDKQGFERTTIFARLEARIIEMQKSYWWKHCTKIGYVGNASKKNKGSSLKGDSSGDGMSVERARRSSSQGVMELGPRDNDRDAEASLALLAMASKEDAIFKDTETQPNISKCTAPTPDMKPSDFKLDNVGPPVTNQALTPMAGQPQTSRTSSAKGSAPRTDTSHLDLRESLISGACQVSNGDLVCPTSNSESPGPCQFGRGDTPVGSMISPQTQQRGTRLTRSMLQRQQCLAKAAQRESANSQLSHGCNTLQPVTSVRAHESDLARGAEDDGDALAVTVVADSSLSLESVDVLESKLEAMKQRHRSLQSDLDKVYDERDSLKGELDEERRRQAMVEDELNKKVEALLWKAKELEEANKLMVECAR